jgi:FixJ family two-component response regulator
MQSPRVRSSPTGQSGTVRIPEHRREHVLYVEDDRILRHALIRVFPGVRFDVATTIAEARARIDRAHAAWVVDERLPDGSGIELVAWAREMGVMVPVLLVTGAADHGLVNRAQLLGIEMAYKPEVKPHLEAFLGRVRQARKAATAVLRAIDALAEVNGLSPREQDLLRTIGRGVPRAALAAELDLSENTVKTLVRRILRKTGATSLDELLRAILVGSLPPPP